MEDRNFTAMNKAEIAEWSGGRISTNQSKDAMIAEAEAMVAAAAKPKAPRIPPGRAMIRVTAAADNPVKVHVNGRLVALLPHGKWVKVPAVALPSLDATGVRYDTRQ